MVTCSISHRKATSDGVKAGWSGRAIWSCRLLSIRCACASKLSKLLKLQEQERFICLWGVEWLVQIPSDHLCTDVPKVEGRVFGA
jgi:hypothetical protein